MAYDFSKSEALRGKKLMKQEDMDRMFGVNSRTRNSGGYSIIATKTGLALDGNPNNCADQTYPRAFMYSSDYTAHNQQWRMHYSEPYWRMENELTGKFLSGNNSVYQYDPNHPMPYSETASSTTYQEWAYYFDELKNTFMICNCATGDALNSNTAAAAQPCAGYPSPWTGNPGLFNPNEEWTLVYHPPGPI